jgi:hypothetical protein
MLLLLSTGCPNFADKDDPDDGDAGPDDDDDDDDDSDDNDDDDAIGETEIRCGHDKSSTTAGVTSTIPSYDIAEDEYDGGENIYALPLAEDARVTFELDTSQQGLDIFLLDQYSDPDQAIAYGDSTFTVDLEAGDYHIVVDGKDGAEGSFKISSTCRSKAFAGARSAYGGDGTATVDWTPPDWAKKSSLTYYVYMADQWGAQDFSDPTDSRTDDLYIASGLTNGMVKCFAIGYESPDGNIFISENQACARPAPVFTVGANGDYANIAQAISAAEQDSDGGNILVRGGSYTDALDINTSKGIGLYGGFSDSWNRDLFNNKSTIQVIGDPITATGGTVLIDGFIFSSGTTGVNVDEGTLYLSNNEFSNQSTCLDTTGSTAADKHLYIAYNTFTDTGTVALNLVDVGDGEFVVDGNLFARSPNPSTTAILVENRLTSTSSASFSILNNSSSGFGNGIFFTADANTTGTKSLNLQIDQNEISAAGTAGIRLASIGSNGSSLTLNASTILRNQVLDSEAGILIEHGDASTSALFTWNLETANNVLADNTTGISATGFDANYSLDGSSIINNVIAYNTVDGLDYDSTGTTTVTNSIFWENDGADIVDDTNLLINYCTVQDGASGTGNSADDPKFEDSSSDDFHLQDISPAINAGNPNVADNDQDGTRNDMGAYGGPNALKP